MRNRIFSCLLILCMLFALFPTSALAAGTADNPESILTSTSITESGVYRIDPDMPSGSTITVTTADAVTIIGAGKAVDVSITINAQNANVTIQDVSITRKLTISQAAILTLSGENSVMTGGNYKEGAVMLNADLTIQANSGGSLYVEGANTYGASIYVPSDRTLTVNSGTIEAVAVSGQKGAAIGGSGDYYNQAMKGGTVNITGGNVIATTNGVGPAIGGGGTWSTGAPSSGMAGLSITGGKVIATSNTQAAAIGTGYSASGTAIPADFSCPVSISGGAEVIANGKVQGTVTLAEENSSLTVTKSVTYDRASNTSFTLNGGTMTVTEGAGLSNFCAIQVAGGTLKNEGTIDIATLSFTGGTLETGSALALTDSTTPLTGTLEGGSLTVETSEPDGDAVVYTLSGTMTDTTLSSGTLTADKNSSLNGNTVIKSGATLTLQSEDSAAATINGTADVESGAAVTGTGFVTGTLDVEGATVNLLSALYTIGSKAEVTGLNNSDKVHLGGNKLTLTFDGYANRPLTLTIGAADYATTTDATGRAEGYVLSANNADIILKTDENVRYTGTVTITGNNKHDDSVSNTINVADLTAMAPEVTSVTPAGNATNIATSTANIVLTFDQEVLPNGVKAVTLTESNNGGTYRCIVSEAYLTTSEHISTLTLPISAFSNGSVNLGLSAGRTYTLALSAGTFIGKADNAIEGASYSFSTAAGKNVVVQISGGGTIRGTVSGSGRTITAAGTYPVAEGSTIQFTAKPNDGYKLDKVEVTRGTGTTTPVSIHEDGVSFTVENVTDATTVKVTFAVDSPSVTLEAETQQGIIVEVGSVKSAYFTTIPLDLTMTADSVNKDIATVGGVGTSGQRRYVNITGVAEGETTIHLFQPDGSVTDFPVTVVPKADGAPTLTAEAATNITANGATLNGSITANGNTILEAGFRIRSYGGGYLMQPGTYDAATGSVTAAVSTLAPSTTYYYHIYAKTPGGTLYGNTTESISNDISFKTIASSSGGSSGGGGGGGGISSSSQPTISVGANGTVKLSGSTLTITPDEGYQVADVTINGKSQGAVEKITGLKSTDKVVVTFEKIGIEPEAPVFTDVPADAYYAEAVAWAVKNGITSGTSDTTFSPDASCTRAQMVTFLWRAAGSPKATGSNPFSDLDSDAYYYDAVLWAAERGITSGTSATTFSPDATVTRAQTVTFLYHAAGAPAVSGSSFADVTADAWYADAVAWAAAEGVTSGTGGNRFSPDENCTRGQTVTFLYRTAE